MPQDGALFPHLRVAANIGFGLDRGMPGRDERILELMDMVELDRSMRDRRPDELSGGQQQRVALARALARRPRLMLLDEPFSALDAGLRDSMRKAVAEVLRAAGITTILVTHDQAEALSFADQVAVLRRGRLVAGGLATRALSAAPGTAAPRRSWAMPSSCRRSWAMAWPMPPRPRCRRRRRAARRGRIMLRPEQVRLTPVASEPADDQEPNACFGRILEVDFAGAVCTVAVALLDDHAPTADAPLRIRSASIAIPPVGALVRVEVVGQAHVFDPFGRFALASRGR